jgi:hypothetical protein
VLALVVSTFWAGTAPAQDRPNFSGTLDLGWPWLSARTTGYRESDADIR